MIHFNTPILLIAWRRPNHLRKIIEQLGYLAPKKLFFAVDGPRFGELYEVERKLINETKKIIENEINWDCEIKVNYQNENLGCRLAVFSAISWFFDNVDAGIIIEDDILPDKSFFGFASELLNKYKECDQIFQISGFNMFSNIQKSRYSYYYSKYPNIWGWATWKRAWNHFDFDIPDIDILKGQLKYLNNKSEINHHVDIIVNGKNIDTWDSYWRYALLKNKGLTIVPTVNLIKNIGFDNSGTHCKIKHFEFYTNLNVEKVDFPLIHNFAISPNYIFDLVKSNKRYKAKGFFISFQLLLLRIWQILLN